MLRAVEGGGLVATVGTPHRRHEGGEVGVLALRLALAHDVDHHGLGHRTRRRARDVEWWSAVCGDGAPVLLQRDVVRALELCAMERSAKGSGVVNRVIENIILLNRSAYTHGKGDLNTTSLLSR